MLLRDFRVPEGSRIELGNVCFSSWPPGRYFVTYASKWYRKGDQKVIKNDSFFVVFSCLQLFCRLCQALGAQGTLQDTKMTPN